MLYVDHAVWLWLSVEVAGLAAILAVGRCEPAAGGGTLVRLLALSWGAPRSAWSTSCSTTRS